MAEPHVISALVKKRSELLGDIQHYEQIIKEFKENLTTIDKTILIFDENYRLSSIKPLKKYRNRYFETGEAKVMILDAIREAKAPLKTEEISDMIIEKKDLSFEDSSSKRTFNKSISNVLATLEKNELVERVGKDGLMVIWQIKAVA